MAWWQNVVPAPFRTLTQMHVMVTALVALFMLVFYLIALFLPVRSPVLQGFNILYCLGCAAILGAIYRAGDKLASWIMYVGALAEVAAFIYFVAFTRNHEQVVFRLQQFPLLALYLSWIFPPWLARCTIYPALLFTIPYGVLIGPAAGTEHSQGILNIAALMFFTVLGTGVGSFVRDRFREQTEVDELTGALNRRALTVYGEQAMLRSRKRGGPLSVAVVDLDGFKTINDTQGHGAGDRILQELVRHWQDAARRTDLIFRLGGDEFVLLFPDTTAPQAQGLMRRMQETSRAAWSFGVAQAGPEDNLGTLVLWADRSMYEAKRPG